jgi:hypothetical protein
MSSLDSAVCAIATTWVIDIFPSPTAEGESDALAARMRRASTIVGFVLIVAALAMASYHARLQSSGGGVTLIDFALSSMTILYGGLLGIFARAVLSPVPGHDRRAVAALIVGCVIGLLLFLHPSILGSTVLAWTWWIPISSLVTYAISAPWTINAPRLRRESN